jgi:hypothetical protein
MGNFWAALKGAKRMEWIIVLAVAAALILLMTSRNAAGGGQTPLEARMEEVLSTVRGAGHVRVLVSEDENTSEAFSSSETSGVVRGVVIVAEGADDLRVALELSGAAQALLGVEANKIQVLKMEESR